MHAGLICHRCHVSFSDTSIIYLAILYLNNVHQRTESSFTNILIHLKVENLSAGMARLHIAAALASATFALLLVFQLFSTFGIPQLNFLRLRPQAPLGPPSLHQIPIDLPSANSGSLKDGTRYLLGVGKADITGYGSERHGP